MLPQTLRRNRNRCGSRNSNDERIHLRALTVIAAQGKPSATMATTVYPIDIGN